MLYNLGYCASFVPKLVQKSEALNDNRTDQTVNRFNYRLTLFSFTSLLWVHQGFYNSAKAKDGIKRVPSWIDDYITPLGLAHWIMGSRQKGQGISLATNSFSYEDCVFFS